MHSMGEIIFMAIVATIGLGLAAFLWVAAYSLWRQSE
jgi:hypothetical protein